MTKDYEKSRSLEAKERRNQIILDNTHEGILYFCLDKRVPIDCNQKALNILGVPDRDTLLKATSEYFYVTGMHNKLPAKEFFARIIKEAKQKPYTYVYQMKNEKGAKMMIKGRAVYDDTRKEAPKVIFFIRNVTEKYIANEETNRLFDQQRQIIEAIPAPFMFRDLNGNILVCNKKLAESRGLENPEELVGLNLRDVLGNKEIEDVLEEDNMIALSEKKIHSRIFSGENGMGEKRWYRNDKTPFLSMEGEVTGVLSYLVDITEIMEQNERLKSYIESNKQLNNFASIASHDLQTPLRTIQSFIQLLQQKLGERLSDEEKEYMQFISLATDNMRHLIRDLRTYSQVDAGRLNIKEFSLDKMVKEILSEIQSVINQTSASIHITTELPSVQGDRIKIKQLVQNLFTNALKYIDKGIVPEVVIHFEDRPKCWYMEMTDNGIGINADYQEQIFELFQRLHNNTDEYQGTGIGLSLCKKVVEQHQGEIGVRSEEGKGSTFYFTIAKHIETVQDLMS
jgi:PAS domain S-box-containing protein